MLKSIRMPLIILAIRFFECGLPYTAASERKTVMAQGVRLAHA